MKRQLYKYSQGGQGLPSIDEGRENSRSSLKNYHVRFEDNNGEFKKMLGILRKHMETRKQKKVSLHMSAKILAEAYFPDNEISMCYVSFAARSQVLFDYLRLEFKKQPSENDILDFAFAHNLDVTYPVLKKAK